MHKNTKNITAANLPDLEDRIKGLGLTMSRALSLINAGISEDGDGKRMTGYQRGTKNDNHHMQYPRGGCYYFKLILCNKLYYQRLFPCVIESRKRRDELLQQYGYKEKEKSVK